jgi:fatty-acyl-CoA synthase
MKNLDILSLGQLLEEGAKSVPDKTAVVDGERRKTYRELNKMAEALAASVSELGFQKGDRVAIYMKNSIELIVAFYALQKLGVIITWINPSYRKAEALFILKNSEAKSVFIFKEWNGYDYLDSIMDMEATLPELKSIIVEGEGKGKGIHSFSDLIYKGVSKTYPSPTIDTKEDLAMLLYTSGTTGKPKGAMITHCAAVRGGYEYSRGINASSEDIFIAVLPMSHSYGCGATLILPLLLQSTVVLMETFDPEKAFQLIEKERITLQLAAPTHYILELNHKNREKYNLSSLRAGLIAGQIAPEGLITRVQEEMGVYISSFWGASEVGPGVGTMCPYSSSLPVRENYIGKAIDGTRIRVVNPDTHEELPEGEKGELTVSGWHVMKGYWKNPEETKKQIIDEWLFMGDIVSREEEGYYKIYGRTKDLINRGGYKIYPYEIESKIVKHPNVQQVCIVATSNPVLGENICACIIPKSGKKVTIEEIRAFLKEKVASHKLPDELCIMKDFPRLSGGVKIDKFGKGGLSELAEKDTNRQRWKGGRR